MKLSNHTKQRMAERNITSVEVVKTIKTGVRYENKHDNTKWTFINREDNCYVVTDKALTVIITVFRTGTNK